MFCIFVTRIEGRDRGPTNTLTSMLEFEIRIAFECFGNLV